MHVFMRDREKKRERRREREERELLGLYSEAVSKQSKTPSKLKILLVCLCFAYEKFHTFHLPIQKLKSTFAPS